MRPLGRFFHRINKLLTVQAYKGTTESFRARDQDFGFFSGLRTNGIRLFFHPTARSPTSGLIRNKHLEETFGRERRDTRYVKHQQKRVKDQQRYEEGIQETFFQCHPTGACRWFTEETHRHPTPCSIS